MAQPDFSSPETNVGYDEEERFAFPARRALDREKAYGPPLRPSLNRWGERSTERRRQGRHASGRAPAMIVDRIPTMMAVAGLGNIDSISSSGKRVR
jgi:hypothetical protein